VENRVYEIASVLSGPRFPAKAEIWLPAPYLPQSLNRTAYNYRAVARLKTGVRMEQAQANLDGIAAQLAAAFPKSNAGKTIAAVPLRELLTGSVARCFIFCWARCSGVVDRVRERIQPAAGARDGADA
jgi:hypothetical protein